jgi:hypothetical protein
LILARPRVQGGLGQGHGQESKGHGQGQVHGQNQAQNKGHSLERWGREQVTNDKNYFDLTDLHIDVVYQCIGSRSCARQDRQGQIKSQGQVQER